MKTFTLRISHLWDLDFSTFFVYLYDLSTLFSLIDNKTERPVGTCRILLTCSVLILRLEIICDPGILDKQKICNISNIHGICWNSTHKYLSVCWKLNYPERISFYIWLIEQRTKTKLSVTFVSAPRYSTRDQYVYYRLISE